MSYSISWIDCMIHKLLLICISAMIEICDSYVWNGWTILWQRLPSGKFRTIEYEFNSGHFFASPLLSKWMPMLSLSIRNEIILHPEYDILLQPLTIHNLKFEIIVQMRYSLFVASTLMIWIVLICNYILCDPFKELNNEFSICRLNTVTIEQGGYGGLTTG